jgi:hypothetical protein
VAVLYFQETITGLYKDYQILYKESSSSLVSPMIPPALPVDQIHMLKAQPS